jgi:hypothetical protein
VYPQSRHSPRFYSGKEINNFQTRETFFAMLRFIAQDCDAAHTMTHFLQPKDVAALLATCAAWHTYARKTPPHLFGGLATRVEQVYNHQPTAWFATSRRLCCRDHAVGALVLVAGAAPITSVALHARWVRGIDYGTRYLEITRTIINDADNPFEQHVVDCLIDDTRNPPTAIHKHGSLHPDTTNDDMTVTHIPETCCWSIESVPGTLECTYTPRTRSILFRDKAHPNLYVWVGGGEGVPPVA